MATAWPMEPWAVSIVGSNSAPNAHLVEDRVLQTQVQPRTLCGVKVSLPARTPFQRSGCKRCCKAALKAGLATVIDLNGDLLDVQALLDGNRT